MPVSADRGKERIIFLDVKPKRGDKVQYVVLTQDKTPAEKLTDGGQSLEQVKDFENLGVLIPEPFIVLDFDTVSDAEIMLNIAQEMKLKCMIMRTTRGYHFWFKSPEPWKNFKKTRLAIGIYADCRSYGKISYVVVKKNGEWREWLQTHPADEIQEVPIWLRPLAFDKYSFKGMKTGDGRNQDLYEYILVMQSKGYNRDQIRKTIGIINDYVFDEPLSEQEIATVLRDESFRDEDELKETVATNECFDEDGGFKHNLFAEMMVEEMNIVTLHEQCYIYKDGYYQQAEREIDREMVRRYRRIRKAQRAEVVDYIKILTTVKSEDIPRQEYILNLKNTRLDLRTGQRLPFDPKIIEFVQLPVEYDPDAYCEPLDRMLDKVFKNDQEVRALFEEMIGYLLIKNCRYRKGFIFYGTGSNGKSTVLNMVKMFIGEENLSTIEMGKLGDSFLTAELENKLANIGDDMDARDIKDTGSLKKLFTGESMTVQRKYQNPFILKNHAKLIFSCNALPRIADKSFGMYSRLTFIPFNARFSSLDEDFDPFIEDKVTTPEGLSYLLNLGLKGLKRLLANNKFTEPAVVKIALENFKNENSTVLTWFIEEGVTVADVVNTPSTESLFSNFQDWCSRSQIKNPPSIRTFHKELEDYLYLERKRVRNNDTNGKYKWKFVAKLDLNIEMS